jgi:transglutaminase-like putative cysteine protease
MKRADALRKLTNKQISHKGMETAFASASETAKNRTGDCSEHGVLLCALLRADGIPARVASGLVYVDGFAGKRGIFGWHMWTQALIDGKWVDLDATLPIRYHAAHVLTGTSSLSDGAGMTDLLSIIQLIGNLDIDVLEVQYDEK